MYTLYNEHIVTDDAEARWVMSMCRNTKAYPENLIATLSVQLDESNNSEVFIKKLRNAPPRTISDNVVRYFSDFFGRILLDLEKKYAEPLAKQGADMVSLFLADRSEIHILPEGGNLKLYFRIGGDGYDAVMQRYGQLKDASLALIKQYLGGLK